ncbi:VOC family protein [Arthrobacter sp. H5]|uniref:VOC family protein n=1 Tax=Arthrobacter sp. H5 TaxID=1267973 RepID=UPI000489C21D|nr:VOC family protein [Arthrobacter sp. H5]
MAGELSFIELGVEDTERGKTFYSELFGWSFEPGTSGKGYTIGGPQIPAGIHSGDKGAAPYLFFRVDDLGGAVERLRALGGTVEDMDVDGGEESVAKFGRFKICRDDQGSPFGLHQPPP